MLAESSNNVRIELKDAKVAAEIAWPGRVLMLVLNTLPLLHVAAIVFAILRHEFLAATGILYLAPPLIARVVLAAALSSKREFPSAARHFSGGGRCFNCR